MRISDWSSDVCSSDLIDIGPGERAGKGRVRRQAEASARLRRQLDLLDRPRLPLGGLAADVLRREAVEQAVVRRMHRDKLALQIRRWFADLDPVAVEAPPQIVDKIGKESGRERGCP